MQKMGSVASILLALSIAYLASAIIYIGFQLSLISPLVDEVEKVRQSLPDVMAEIAEVRKEVPVILAEVAAVRKEIPAMVAEVTAVRKTVPSVLAEVAAVRKMTPSVLAEVEQVRKQIPPILAEVKTTREAIPGMLDRAQGVVDGAEHAGAKATKGAITGVLTGVLGAPVNVMRHFTSNLLGTTELEKGDLSRMSDASQKVVSVDKVGTKQHWNNTENETEGTVELVRKVSVDEQDCRVLRVITNKSGKQLTDAEITLCHLPSGEWKLQPKS